jgi:hypothetical protein
MKYIFAAIFLLPLSLLAQDCTLKKEKDKFSDQPKVTTGLFPMSSGTDKILVSIEATATDIDFLFALSHGGEQKCFDNASTAILSYDSLRLKTTYRNSGSMNCEGLFHFNFRNTPTLHSNLKRLSTTKVASIRFTGNDKTVTEVILTEEDKVRLMDMAGCIIKEAQSLRTK